MTGEMTATDPPGDRGSAPGGTKDTDAPGPATSRAIADPAGATRPTLLLATDLSPASEAATERALDLARRLGAAVLAVSVIDPGTLRLPGGRFGARVDQVRATKEREAQALVHRGRAVGVPVTFLIWQGDPGEVIVEAARSEGVEMIVVGSHGRRGVERALLGSVSDHVVRQAPCPVLVVRSDVERQNPPEDLQRV
jgi:nucleotide-binding universal stress UspA family protein